MLRCRLLPNLPLSCTKTVESYMTYLSVTAWLSGASEFLWVLKVVGGVTYSYHKWNTEMADSKDPPIAHKAGAIVHTQIELTPQDETHSSKVIFHQKQRMITLKMVLFCHPICQQDHFIPCICLHSIYTSNNINRVFVQVKSVTVDWKPFKGWCLCGYTDPLPYSHSHVHTDSDTDALTHKVYAFGP